MNKAVILSLVIILFLGVLFAAFYYFNDDYKVEYTCGDFPIEERDECCAIVNNNTVHAQCVGQWKYEDSGSCSFVCNQTGN